MPRSYCRFAALALLAAPFAVNAATPAERARWNAQAARVTIVRDDWGIAHIRGKTDADAVFGMIYAQAEDDFNRIEANYLTSLGRTAEAPGAADDAVWEDLRQRLYVDPADLKARFAKSPAWLRVLMTAWADGLNHYLVTHPAVKPKVITRFEPWMALSFTEGSIGGDIERISTADLAAFYGNDIMIAKAQPPVLRPPEPSGSNGIAIAPKNTKDGRALLLINPHTSFYFRSELHMRSDAGLNVYGAATWGQFFIYQGFNERIGWMHTSSGVDNVDEFAETIVRRGPKLFYKYGAALRPVTSKRVVIAVRGADGTLTDRVFTTYATHHGPVVAKQADGKWLAQALMWKPTPALEQSWLRTTTSDVASYLKVASRQANSSNDTLIADAKGEIAYLHPQFVPVRSGAFDYRKPVDGADPATDWQGLHAIATLPNVIDPKTGWVMNTNNHPWSAAGPDSPKAADFPAYMDTAGENARGVHATMLLTDKRDFTPEALIAAAYDPYLTAFATMLPTLTAAYDALPPSDVRKAALAEPIASLRGWDYKWSATSQPTALAVFWGEALWAASVPLATAAGIDPAPYMETRATPEAKLAALEAAVARLTRDFGGWRVAWGDINRFQRLDNQIVAVFDDAAPSIAVPFTSAQWGSLAAYGSRSQQGTKKYYGTYGNSFVAVVEFGPTLRAWAVTAGGESGDPASPHFRDQAQRYADGALRPVYFYDDDIAAHAKRTYKPGE